MARSIGLVDDKVAEADFFLEELGKRRFDLFAARCYFNAFVSASRSITFSLQAVMSEFDGFSNWYEIRQDELKGNELARFFVTARNLTHKIGEHPVTAGSMRATPNGAEVELRFSVSHDFPAVPSDDVVTACRAYLSMLVDLVLSCYEQFGRVVDPDQYYTAEAFAERGLTIDDADEEVIGIRGWTCVPGVPEEARWQMLRDSVPGCEIDELFEMYAGRTRPTPERVLPKEQPAQGWVYIPDELRVTGDPEEDVRRFIAKLKRDKDV
jgi:hypothetical protein